MTVLVELALQELQALEGTIEPSEVTEGLGDVREALMLAHDHVRPLYARTVERRDEPVSGWTGMAPGNGTR